MMCLLPSIPDLELPQYIPSSPDIVPLLVKFTDDCVPLSCFSSTISCLLSTFNWSVCRKVDGTPECLAHNIVSLFSPAILTDSIVLVESAHYIEVYIEADEETRQFLPRICSEVRETVFSAIMKVLDLMQVTGVTISPAIPCPCKKVAEPHSATVFPMQTEYFLRCSSTNKRVGKAQSMHLTWLGSNSQPGKKFNELSLPKLMELRVPEQVGTSYKQFGTRILDDEKGILVDSIKEAMRGEPKKINTEILQYWLQGKGLPVTWETLLDTLRVCCLNESADQIQASVHTH